MEVRKPEFEGQICTIISPLDDENPEDVYVVAEDPAPFDGDDDIYVVNLNDLQRNINNPVTCQQIAVAKNELNVIADNLQDYICSWKSRPN
jgi:hypothetical protein